MIAFPHRSLVLALAAVIGLISSSCSDNTMRQVEGSTTAIDGLTARATGTVPFARTWELQLPGPVEHSWIGAQVPELVFFQIAETHAIHCVEVRSGRTLWITGALPKEVFGTPYVQRLQITGTHDKETVVRDRMFMVLDDALSCLDLATGQVMWHLDLPFAPSTGPLAAGVNDGSLRVFIGDWNNRVQVIALHLGTSDSPQHTPFVVWQMAVDGAIRSSGTEHEGLAYFGDTDGHLTCFKLDRAKVWSVATGGAVDGGAVVRDRAIYVGNDSNSILAINRLTGERLGQFNLAGAVQRRPFWFTGERQRLYAWVTGTESKSVGLAALRVQQDNVAFADTNKHALEVVRMGQDWFLPGAKKLISSTPLHFLVSGDQESLIWAVHRGTGKVAWTWSLDQGWPGNTRESSGAVVSHVVSYHDASDSLRTLIASDDRGYVAAFTMFDFVPTPEQESAGISSRALINAPASAQPAAAPVAK